MPAKKKQSKLSKKSKSTTTYKKGGSVKKSMTYKKGGSVKKKKKY